MLERCPRIRRANGNYDADKEIVGEAVSHQKF